MTTLTMEDERALVMGRLLDRSVDYGRCWLWTGATNGVGYGVISYQGKRWYTHRLSYTVCRGPIPEGLVIDHLCGQTLCFSPEHLDPVTKRVNSVRALVEQRTHCKRGHEFTEANTYRITATGHRSCRTCRATRERARRARLFNIGRTN